MLSFLVNELVFILVVWFTLKKNKFLRKKYRNLILELSKPYGSQGKVFDIHIRQNKMEIKSAQWKKTMFLEINTAKIKDFDFSES